MKTIIKTEIDCNSCRKRSIPHILIEDERIKAIGENIDHDDVEITMRQVNMYCRDRPACTLLVYLTEHPREGSGHLQGCRRRIHNHN